MPWQQRHRSLHLVFSLCSNIPRPSVSNRQQSQSALMSLLGGPCSDVLTGLDLTDTWAPPLGNATRSAPDRPEDPLDEAAEPIAEQPAAYRISCRDHPPCLCPKPEPGPRR